MLNCHMQDLGYNGNVAHCYAVELKMKAEHMMIMEFKRLMEPSMDMTDCD